MKSFGRIIRCLRLIFDPPLRVPAADLERLVKEIDAELARAAVPPGLVTCDGCGAHVATRGGHYAVHFASIAAARPCARSWPTSTTRSST